MSAKAGNSAGERVAMEKINETMDGNVRGIQKGRGHTILSPSIKCLSHLSHGSNLSCLLSGNVDWQKRSRNRGGNGGYALSP